MAGRPRLLPVLCSLGIMCWGVGRLSGRWVGCSATIRHFQRSCVCEYRFSAFGSPCIGSEETRVTQRLNQYPYGACYSSASHTKSKLLILPKLLQQGESRPSWYMVAVSDTSSHSELGANRQMGGDDNHNAQ